MARRKRQKPRKRARIEPQAPTVISSTAPSAADVARVTSDPAVRSIERVVRRKGPDIDAALLAAERAIEMLETERRPSMRERMRRWWQTRRHRSLIRRLDRSLTTPVEDRSSAALLAVLTERIARIEKSATPVEVKAAIEVAAKLTAEYRTAVARVEAMRDSASEQVIRWRANVATAEETGESDLADLARVRLAEWERREREATSAWESCDEALSRIADALAQLEKLARRVATSREQRGRR